MVVHAYCKEKKRHYKSLVYAAMKMQDCNVLSVPEKLNAANEYAVLYNPFFERFELVAREEENVLKIAGVQTINRMMRYVVLNEEQHAWIQAQTTWIARLNQASGKKVFSVKGYEDVVNNLVLWTRLLDKSSVPADEVDIGIRSMQDGVWTYIESQEQADVLLHAVGMMHDATIDKMTHEEGENHTFTLTMDISVSGQRLQLCFEGVMIVCRKTPLNGQREMAFGYIAVHDDYVLWLDERNEKELDEETTYIKSLALKWRKT